MPKNAIYVGRPTKWGNPWKERVDGDLDYVLMKYRAWLNAKLMKDSGFLDPLRGKDLVCWCPLDQPCHADILIEFLKGEPK